MNKYENLKQSVSWDEKRGLIFKAEKLKALCDQSQIIANRILTNYLSSDEKVDRDGDWSGAFEYEGGR